MKIDEGNQISANKLLQMTWYDIMSQNLIDELFTTVWCNDTMLNELLYRNKFNISPGKASDATDNTTNKMISFWTMCEKYSDFTDKKLFMGFLFNKVFAKHKDATVECIIKYIKANLIVALLVSKSLTQIFSNISFDITSNTYLRGKMPKNLSWSILDEDPPVGNIIYYTFQLVVDKFNKSPKSLIEFTTFTFEISNPWMPIKWAKLDDIKNKTLNEIIEDAPIFININENNTWVRIEDLAKHIKHVLSKEW